MIRHLMMGNFKSLVNFSLPLARFTCLVGLNGAGKTTLLQAIDFLAQVMGGNVEGWLKEREWSVNDINFNIPFPFAKKQLIFFHISLELDGRNICWEGKFNIRKLRCTSERVILSDHKIDAMEVENGRYKIAGEPRKMISFEYYGSILSQLKETNFGEHQQILVELKRFFNDVKSLELLSPNLMRKRAKKAEDIGIGGERLSAFLSQLSSDEREKLSVDLKKFSPNFHRFSTRALLGGWKQLFINETVDFSGGLKIPLETEARHINDGLLRQLAILAQTTTDHRVLLFDEIENGMNQELVDKLVDHLVNARQQIIVTTHSPQILNFIPDDVAREGVILLYRTPQGFTRARRYFDLPGPAEKLLFLGPGEVYADTPLHDVVQSALDKDREEDTSNKGIISR
ncbi:MAG: AAA family ATPase [Magnetococcales bacterium]|nr:AAA family ATPase [Magnetococcales bacterium]